MNMMRRFVLSLLLATMCLMAGSLSASAFDPFGGACNQNTGDAVTCKSNDNTDSVVKSGPKAILVNITNIVAYIAGAVAVIMIIVGGIRFITAGSDVSTGSRTDTDVEDARRSVAGALIGLAVIVLAKTIITYAIRRL